MSVRRGKVIEVEVDHSRVPYADFVRIVSELGGRVLVKVGYWPSAKYKIAIPKKRMKELLRVLEEAHSSGAESEITAR